MQDSDETKAHYMVSLMSAAEVRVRSYARKAFPVSELATAYCAGGGGAMASEMAQVFAVVEDEIRATTKRYRPV